MKRSDFYLRLTTAVLFIAVVCYIGISILSAAGTSYETAAAISCTVEDTGDVAGYVVRDEFAVPGGGSGSSPAARDGEKVASGYVIAVGYQNDEALRRAGEIREVKLKLEQLEAAGNAGAARQTESAPEIITELSRIMHSGTLSGLDAAVIRAQSLVLTGASALTADDLPALRARLAELEADSAGDSAVRAPKSGVYSHVVDGYEGVGPEMLSGLTPGGLTALFAAPVSETQGTAGKLITGIRWYYAVTTDLAGARRLSAGKNVQVRFKGDYQGVVSMRVDSVGRMEDEECVVVLSSAEAIAEVSGVRYIGAEIVFDTFTGIRVPKEAIHLGDNGETYVYLQTGAQAERADITILTEFGDSYLAVNAGPKLLLRDGATIITKANNLDDGKVVRG